MPLIKSILILCLPMFLMLYGTDLSAQQENADSLYYNTYPDTWSLRTYGIIKAQGMQLVNKNGDRLRYLPDNIFGLGLGVSYKFLMLDLGVTLGGPNTISERFDFQGSLFMGKNMFDIYLQLYRGFHVVHPENVVPASQEKRQDIRTVATGINYMYSFKGDKLSARSVFIGDYQQKRSIGSFMVGGFTSFYLMKADSSIVPAGDTRFGDEAQITNLNLNSTGIAAGYMHIWVLKNGLAIFASVAPGIGLNGGDAKSEEWYSPPYAPVYKIKGNLGINYSMPKCTIHSLIMWTAIG